jgi:Ca2+-binding RTX toxin-like protein
MASGTATIVGGHSVTLSLNPLEFKAAQDALFTIGKGFTNSTVLTSATDQVPSPPNPTTLFVYNVSPPPAPSSPLAQAFVLLGENDASLTGHSGQQVLIGNQGNDTINAAGGSGTIIGGDGNNTVDLNNAGAAGGTAFIEFGIGKDVVNMWGGNVEVSNVGGSSDTVNAFNGANTVVGDVGLTVALNGGNDSVSLHGNSTVNITGTGSDTIDTGSTASVINISDGGTAASVSVTGSGSDTVNITGGSNTVTASNPINASVTGGTNTLKLSGNDTIFIGSGSDTLSEAGTATVHGGTGSVKFTALSGNDSIVAGSGNATIIAGSGNNTVVAGAFTEVDAGSGHDTFFGGKGTDTFNGSGAASNLFVYDSAQGGGTHVIANFTSGRDQIALTGYDSTTALNNAKVVGGNTVISLDGGKTTITLTGFTHLSASDFVH